MALAAVVVAVAALPLAMASAGPLGDAERAADRLSGSTDDRSRSDDPTGESGPAGAGPRDAGTRDGEAHDGAGKGAAVPGDAGHTGGPGTEEESAGGPDADGAKAGAVSPGLLDLGLATTARCGSELSSPDGIEAQTCVLRQDEETWARAYYRNATGRELSSVLSLMGPDGRSVRMHCFVDAQDEPGVCETPKQRTGGDLAAYTAVAEFAADPEKPGAGPADTGRTPLLLRAGSNSPEPLGG